MKEISKKHKVALVHPDIVLGGGPEAITLQTIEALKKKYNLTLITMSHIKLDQLNEFYQTRVKNNDINIIYISPPFLMKDRKKFSSIRKYKFDRFCKNISHKFDLMISMYNVMDFGRRGIQYIHDPNFNEKLRSMIKPEKKVWKKWFYRDSFYRKFYIKLSNYLSKFTFDGMKKNLTLTSSEWTGKITTKIFHMDTCTLYPPIQETKEAIPWEKKENGFVCLGRIVSDKRLEVIIKILVRVRRLFKDVHLHIIGRFMDESYKKYLLEHHINKKHWIFLNESVSGEMKSRLLNLHKFGIHGKKNEPFGMAVAEMIKAGNIVWVPDGGGQVEITNNEKLIFKDIDDAVFKISQVLNSDRLQKNLISHLKSQSNRFSIKVFRNRINSIVQEELLKKQ